MYGRGMGDAVAGLVIALCVFSVVIGGLIVWLAPKVWAWIKPIIHAVTA